MRFSFGNYIQSKIECLKQVKFLKGICPVNECTKNFHTNVLINILVRKSISVWPALEKVNGISAMGQRHTKNKKTKKNLLLITKLKKVVLT